MLLVDADRTSGRLIFSARPPRDRLLRSVLPRWRSGSRRRSVAGVRRPAWRVHASRSGGYWLEGGPDPNSVASGRRKRFRVVTPSYFHTMHVPLRRGRDFSGPAGPVRVPFVAVVNEALARQSFPAGWIRSGAPPCGLDFAEFNDGRRRRRETCATIDPSRAAAAGDLHALSAAPSTAPPRLTMVRANVGGAWKLASSVRADDSAPRQLRRAGTRSR